MKKEDLLNDLKRDIAKMKADLASNQASQITSLNNAIYQSQNQLAQQNMARQLGQVSPSGSISSGNWNLPNMGGAGINGGNYPGISLGQGLQSPGFSQNDPLEEELAKKKSRINIKDLDISTATDTIEKVLRTSIVPFLWGPPGIGKSTLVKEIANRNKWKLIDLRLSLLNPVDLRGLPVIDKENKQADWYPPTFLPKFDTKDTGILFLDEINLAPLSVQAAAYQLILDKRVGEYRFPPHWKIVAAGNRETDKANVYKLSAPLANRFVHFNMTASFLNWRVWARERKIRPEILDFLTLRPALLLQMPTDSQKAFPSPRSWEFTSDLLDAFGYDANGQVDEELQQLIVGTIGEGTGKELISFMQEWDLQATSKMVSDFISTGKFTMPKAASLRYAFVTAVFGAHIDKVLSDNLYKKFFEKLSGEEKKTLEMFEEENKDKFAARRKTIPGPNMNKPMGVLAKSITASSKSIRLTTQMLFPTKQFIIFDNNGNMEYCSYTTLLPKSIEGVKRGELGTKAMSWPPGTFVQPI